MGELIAAILGWMLTDWRRAAGALGVVLVGGGSLFILSHQPATGETICGQAVAMRTELDASSGQIFSNGLFDAAGALGKSASNPDSAANAPTQVVNAGKALASVSDRNSAYEGAFSGPLSTIESWCSNRAALASVSPPAQNAVPQDAPVAAETPVPDPTVNSSAEAIQSDLTWGGFGTVRLGVAIADAASSYSVEPTPSCDVQTFNIGNTWIRSGSNGNVGEIVTYDAAVGTIYGMRIGQPVSEYAILASTSPSGNIEGDGQYWELTDPDFPGERIVVTAWSDGNGGPMKIGTLALHDDSSGLPVLGGEC